MELTMKQEFNPFDRVLVRVDNSQCWTPDLYHRPIPDPDNEGKILHEMITGCCYEQCIPYEGNERLCGRSESEVWTPVRGDKYYYIGWIGQDGSFTVVPDTYNKGHYCEGLRTAGNMFRTEEDAREIADELTKTWRRFLKRKVFVNGVVNTKKV